MDTDSMVQRIESQVTGQTLKQLVSRVSPSAMVPVHEQVWDPLADQALRSALLTQVHEQLFYRGPK